MQKWSESDNIEATEYGVAKSGTSRYNAVRCPSENKITKIRTLKGINIFLLLISLFAGIGMILAAFTSNPEINPGISTIYTDQDLTCQWTLNESLEATVNWYKNGALNLTYAKNCSANIPCSTTGSGIVSKEYTTKGDIWKCEVIHDPGTGNETQNYSINISDSVPTVPQLYYPNGSVINGTTIPYVAEDNTTTFYLNSSDADSDAIRYILDSTNFGCSIIQLTGEITCTPTTESQLGIKTLRFKAEDLNSGATNGYVNRTINITPTNDAPRFSPTLTNRSVLENNALNYTISGADDESDIPYNFSITTTLSSLIVESVSNTSARIKFNNSGTDAASFNDRGNHTVNVTIQDNGSPPRSTTQTFNLEVIPQNYLATIAYHISNEGSLIQGGQLYIEINASDVDNDTLNFFSSNPALYNITYGLTNKSNPNGTSWSRGIINVTSMSNEYVFRNSFTIIVFDSKENTSNSLTLNITNTNDAPVINNFSYYPINTLNNSDIDNLTAYTGVYFRYRVNATDVDTLTYESDTITFSTNDSAEFPIEVSTGIISFVKNNTGSHLVSVTVTDSYNATYNRTANITIQPNQNPYFTEANISITCYEYDAQNYAANCSYNLSANTSEDDVGDYIESYWINTSLFNLSNGFFSFRPNQSDVGNYSIMFNITDSRGGINSTTVTLYIFNTNNVPVIEDAINIPPGRMRIGTPYQISVTASDRDLSLVNTDENLTFNVLPTGPNTSLFTYTKTDIDEAAINFYPTTASDAGNYTLNITVTDDDTNTSAPVYVNFFIYNVTTPPNISVIAPFGTPIINGSVNISLMNRTYFPTNVTNITIYENTSYLFNQTTILDESYPNNAYFRWMHNGSQVSTSSSVTNNYGFFSNGTHLMNFTVTDDFNKSASFLWNIFVLNVNRPPQVINKPQNLTGGSAVNGTTTYNGYMTYYGSMTRFYDPDEDLNSNGYIEDDELRMTFNSTICSFATFTFIGTSLKVTTEDVGDCYVNFTATDADNSSEYVIAENIHINVTYVSNETDEVPIPDPRGGGGGSATRTITIPLPEEVDRPKPLEIVAPKLVTIYKNATLKVPIVLNNTWNDTLEGVTLSAHTNASNVTTYIDRVFFPRLAIGEVQDVTLLIENYKSEGHYEISIRANVTNPEFQDTATIFVNSADTKSEGEELQTMISFAADLLSANPECQELTEILNMAKKELGSNNYMATAKLVDSVINGCKYLMENIADTERPSSDFRSIFEWRSRYGDYVLLGAFTILFIIALVYLVKKDHTDF